MQLPPGRRAQTNHRCYRPAPLHCFMGCQRGFFFFFFCCYQDLNPGWYLLNYTTEVLVYTLAFQYVHTSHRRLRVSFVYTIIIYHGHGACYFRFLVARKISHLTITYLLSQSSSRSVPSQTCLTCLNLVMSTLCCQSI